MLLSAGLFPRGRGVASEGGVVVVMSKVEGCGISICELRDSSRQLATTIYSNYLKSNGEIVIQAKAHAKELLVYIFKSCLRMRSNIEV